MTTTPTNSSVIRPPIIVIMGHIDHGKSTLLDYIRQTKIVDQESGGITQHTSAYEVPCRHTANQASHITFLDTPGHEAFTTMRCRGANIADLAILIVSAEDGVKAQTLEAYQSILEAQIPFIVAINKIDRPNANIERTKQSLAENNILVEGYGGQIPVACISAKTGQGVDELLELALIATEMEELTGDPQAPASGYVLEGKVDQRAGITATLIIKNGTLKNSDYLVAGPCLAKIKKLENFLGQTITQASFSAPVRVYGFSQLPPVGCDFLATSDKKQAQELVSVQSKTNCPNTELNDCSEDVLTIPLIAKADTCGTVEALEKCLGKIKADRVRLKIINSGVGAINENDIKSLGSNRPAIVVGFRVKIEKGADDLIEKNKLDIFTSDIIYQISEWLEEKINQLTPKQTSEETIGRARILKIFNKEKGKQVVGGSVLSGKIIRNRECKIFRREAEICRGRIADLQQQKSKTDEVSSGNQFGAAIDAKLDLATSDIIEIFETVTR